MSCPEPFLTIREAAKVMELPYWKLLEAVKRDLIPTYSLFNKRRYVKVSDIERVMKLAHNTLEEDLRELGLI